MNNNSKLQNAPYLYPTRPQVGLVSYKFNIPYINYMLGHMSASNTNWIPNAWKGLQQLLYTSKLITQDPNRSTQPHQNPSNMQDSELTL